MSGGLGVNRAKMRQTIPRGSNLSSSRDSRIQVGHVKFTELLHPGDFPEGLSQLLIIRVGHRGSVTTRQTTIAISRTDKAIVLDPAAYTIKAVFPQCFNPYHANSTKNWPHSISAVRMMHRNTQCALSDLTWYKCSVRLTVESITAEIVSHRLHALGRTGPDETQRPVDLHPGSSSTLPYYRIRFVNLMHVQVGWETVDRFRQHKKVPSAKSIFRATNKPRKTVANPRHTNYLHQFSMFRADLQIPPKDRKTCRSSMRTGDYVRLDTCSTWAILTNVS